MRDLHLGYTDSELVSSPYAPFYRPQMAKLPAHVKHALLNGAVAEELMPGVEFAAQLQNDGYMPVETGYTLAADKSARVSVLTNMPGVTPAMWDWWFAWHGSEAQRYKLWHPRSHVHVAWEEGLEDLGAYVGRTSQVVEYIGSTRMDLKIRFVPPASLGVSEHLLREKGEVAICARTSIGSLHSRRAGLYITFDRYREARKCDPASGWPVTISKCVAAGVPGENFWLVWPHF